MSSSYQARVADTEDIPLPALYTRRGRGPKPKSHLYDVRDAANRLIRLRHDAGYSSAAQAATAIGVNVVTYQHHENGRRAISPQSAESYAKFFGVTPGYILYGDMLPKTSGVPIVGIVGAKGFVHMLIAEEQATAVPPPPGDPNTLLVPIIVDGSDLYPAYHHGDTLWYDPDELYADEIDAERVKGRDCVVRLSDGRILIRRVMLVETSGYAHLSTYSNEEVLRMPVFGAAMIEWVRKRPRTPS